MTRSARPRTGWRPLAGHESRAARRQEAERREFIANASHELRTPVAAIRGFAEVLREGALNDPRTAAEFVAAIERNALRLGSLIDRLLDLSMADAGRLRPRPRGVEVASVVRGMAANLRLPAAAAGVSFSTGVPRGLRARVDPDHLSRVLQNLCDNAIKYTRRGGKASVTARRRGRMVELSVADTGRGIPRKELPGLFQRFRRGARSRRSGVPGSGLGLAIVKTLVEANGGSVAARSGPRGSRFVVSLPAA